MTGGRSAWRADDVVAYDAMREEANSAIALLLRLSDSRAIKADQAVSEAIDIREMMSDIDGYHAQPSIQLVRVSPTESLNSRTSNDERLDAVRG